MVPFDPDASSMLLRSKELWHTEWLTSAHLSLNCRQKHCTDLLDQGDLLKDVDTSMKRDSSSLKAGCGPLRPVQDYDGVGDVDSALIVERIHNVGYRLTADHRVLDD